MLQVSRACIPPYLYITDSERRSVIQVLKPNSSFDGNPIQVVPPIILLVNHDCCSKNDTCIVNLLMILFDLKSKLQSTSKSSNII